MPETYKAWADGGAAFVYLTNSPYQLYGPLQRYLQGEKHYPEGAYYMRSVGKDDLRNTIVKLLAIDGDVAIEENPKKHNLIPILEAFPGRRFILVGDSTELDADIYADLYQGKRFPRGFRAPPNGYADRIAKIYIRDVKSSKKRKEADDAIRRINNPDVARFFDSNRPDILSDGLTVVTSDRGRGTTR
jgi:phosphatidate phosphatase APP1